jgi:hypothetical protein
VPKEKQGNIEVTEETVGEVKEAINELFDIVRSIGEDVKNTHPTAEKMRQELQRFIRMEALRIFFEAACSVEDTKYHIAAEEVAIMMLWTALERLLKENVLTVDDLKKIRDLIPCSCGECKDAKRYAPHTGATQ